MPMKVWNEYIAKLAELEQYRHKKSTVTLETLLAIIPDDVTLPLDPAPINDAFIVCYEERLGKTTVIA